jgi:hypothetical protein
MAQQQDEAVTTSREHQALYQHTLQQQQQQQAAGQHNIASLPAAASWALAGQHSAALPPWQLRAAWERSIQEAVHRHLRHSVGDMVHAAVQAAIQPALAEVMRLLPGAAAAGGQVQ